MPDFQKRSRRQFLECLTAVLCSPVLAKTRAVCGAAPRSVQELQFVSSDKGFRFDTGQLSGLLREGGKSLGLRPVIDQATGKVLTRSMGLCSHYRLLDDQHRYGEAGWTWNSRAGLLDDGSVRVSWSADREHPFSMTADYRWAAANTLDVTTSVAAERPLKRFEVFLASYFEGFASAFVYAKANSGTGAQAAGLVPAERSLGRWQMFPRDPAAVETIRDGRWHRPPHPVDWSIRSELAGALAVRRDQDTGLVGLVMSTPADCFAIATPYSREGHRSLYLSLLGRDLEAGRPATVQARLVIARGITDTQAIELYTAYQDERAKTGD